MPYWVKALALLPLLLSALPAWAQSAIHHAVTLNVDVSQKTITVQDTVTIEGNGTTTFRLDQPFELDSVTLNGSAAEAERDQTTVRVDLGLYDRHTLKFSYRAQGHPLLLQDGALFERGWLAHPENRLATWKISAHINAGQKIVVPGKLTDEQDTAEGYRATFTMNKGHGAPVLITGPYIVDEALLGDVRLRTYFHEELRPLAEDYLSDARRYVGYYTRAVGAYPYDGFFIISGNQQVGWGLPGMTYMGRRVLKLPFIRYTSLPHEVLHNWWGNAVEVDYAFGNWAEGLTTYQADHALAAAAKEGGGVEKRQEWLRNYAALPPDQDTALSQFQSKIHDAAQVVGYGKTAFVFHMLKVRLGGNMFRRALQRFYREQQFQTASWIDIQKAFDAESGENLQAFFRAWTERPGAPELKLSNVERTIGGVRFTLSQSDDTPPFPLFVPVHIDTAQGTEVFNIPLDTASRDVELNVQNRATTVRVDPNYDVFRRLSQAERPPILRDITLDPSTTLVPFGEKSMRDIAYRLAQSLLQTRMRMLDAEDSRTQIVSGTPDQVDLYLQRFGAIEPPADIRQRGDARAWTTRYRDGRTILVVEAEDESALAALARVLPHYKRRSWVVMENGETIDNGTLSAGKSPLTVSLE